jgi:hypothetical protein
MAVARVLSVGGNYGPKGRFNSGHVVIPIKICIIYKKEWAGSDED